MLKLITLIKVETQKRLTFIFINKYLLLIIKNSLNNINKHTKYYQILKKENYMTNMVWKESKMEVVEVMKVIILYKITY